MNIETQNGCFQERKTIRKRISQEVIPGNISNSL